MYIEAVLKCNVDNAPYRVYINNELITERFYTILDHTTISNTLHVQLKNAENYNIEIENLSENTVILERFTVKENKNALA